MSGRPAIRRAALVADGTPRHPRRRRAWPALGIALGTASWQAAAAALPSRWPVVPFDADSRPVLADGHVAGMRASIVRFRSPLKSEHALDAARRQWSRGGAQVIAATAGAWQTLSRRSSDAIWTLQISDTDRGSVGLLTLWRLAPGEPAPIRRARELVPASMRIVSASSDEAGPERVGTVIARSDEELLPAWRALVSHLRAKGFQAESAGRDGVDRSGGVGTLFRAEQERVAATIEPRAGASWLVLRLQQASQP